MNIDEKEKVQYSHKLEIRRLILDKALFGLIVIAIGLLINLLFEQYKNKLEQDRAVLFEEYKSKLEQNRFLLEKRLEAVNAMREAFAQMHEGYVQCVISEKRMTSREDQLKFNTSIHNYAHASNKGSILVSPEFVKKTSNLLWIYDGLPYRNTSECNKYGSFINDLSDYLESLCRHELGVPDESHSTTIPLKELTWDEAESLGAKKVLDLQFEKWEEWAKAKVR